MHYIPIYKENTEFFFKNGRSDLFSTTLIKYAVSLCETMICREVPETERLVAIIMYLVSTKRTQIIFIS